MRENMMGMQLVPTVNIDLIKPKLVKINESLEDTNIVTNYELTCHVDMGYTLGNAIRRVCLTDIIGYSIVAFKLNGAQHAYDAPSGIKETVEDIIMNLKNVHLKLKNVNYLMLKMNKTNDTGKAMVVTAGDFEVNENVIIANKNHVIATLDLNHTIQLEILISVGRGYVRANEHKFNQELKDFIPIDSIFSPVITFAYEVQRFTGGYLKNDKVLISVTTNGTHNGDEIMNIATDILYNNFKEICSLHMTDMSSTMFIQEKVATQQNTIMDQLVRDSELTVRTKNILTTNEINTIGQLIQLTEKELRAMGGLGDVCVSDIMRFLSERGLNFGTKNK